MQPEDFLSHLRALARKGGPVSVANSAGVMDQTPGMAAISFLEDSDDSEDPAVYAYRDTIPTLMATDVDVPLRAPS